MASEKIIRLLCGECSRLDRRIVGKELADQLAQAHRGYWGHQDLSKEVVGEVDVNKAS